MLSYITFYADGNVPLREVFSDLTKVEASGGVAPAWVPLDSLVILTC